ncbi:hypothetical protein KIL84_020541 [Mauremys mutica]|uniref:Uncharacterized protein n=1 Tax=Mauremys mutica TaxID=74926 RepID=A0A9D3XXD8_9SAUR|nr:hypothetical protein KIL84_020541 [Mauremys mutica]
MGLCSTKPLGPALFLGSTPPIPYLSFFPPQRSIKILEQTVWLGPILAGQTSALEFAWAFAVRTHPLALTEPESDLATWSKNQSIHSWVLPDRSLGCGRGEIVQTGQQGLARLPC